ncbi:hydrogenase maturation nickel metallochaperone HypA [Helicobacter burdigaliensis]|uniref:hydrogenase maturation nickel metallochaperone HypA n=1 Tax=Helicobacter burdigaliensis TaxID=2315334 RepID=UPI000EF6F1BC|nr:hydrogenase maturation nickel metallochaperone HypA [Helicobacter burdigaliensis]
MHEFSIVASLFENLESLANKHKATRILEVEVELGERSGVNKELFYRAFEEYKIGSKAKMAQLKIKEVKVTLFCQDCKEELEVKELDYTHCPKCKQDRVKIVKGNEMLLTHVEME